jgi:hypothetical protein
MRLLIRKSLASAGAIIVSLALAGNAFAAGTHVKTGTRAAAPPFRATLDVAAIPPYPNYTPEAFPAARTRGFDVAAQPYEATYPYRSGRYPVAGADAGQLFGALFGGMPVQYRGRAAASGGGSSDTAPDSPTYDIPAASDSSAAAAAIQQANDEAALNASVAAAEQQNEAAQAAAIQTEINAGM